VGVFFHSVNIYWAGSSIRQVAEALHMTHALISNFSRTVGDVRRASNLLFNDLTASLTSMLWGI